MEKPFIFCIYGEECLEGYKIIKKSKPENIYFNLKYYLLCRAMELFLKAFLLGRGMTVSVLSKKNYGHNIKNLLNQAMKLKITEVCDIKNEDVMIINRLSSYYANKEFEYVSDNVHCLCDLKRVEGIAEKLYIAIDEFTEKLLYK